MKTRVKENFLIKNIEILLGFPVILSILIGSEFLMRLYSNFPLVTKDLLCIFLFALSILFVYNIM